MKTRPVEAPPEILPETLCPLCGLKFRQGVEHCVACPARSACEVVCCPRCGYQFVERSALIEWIERWWHRLRRAAGKDATS